MFLNSVVGLLILRSFSSGRTGKDDCTGIVFLYITLLAIDLCSLSLMATASYMPTVSNEFHQYNWLPGQITVMYFPL